MGAPALLAEFASWPSASKRRADVDGRRAAWVGELDAGEALGRLDAAEVPCSLVNSVRDLFDDPHIRARENIVSVPSPDGLLSHGGRRAQAQPTPAP